MIRRALVRGLVAALPLVVTAAHAQPAQDLEQAKTYFNAGAQAFGAGQFTAAVQAFEEAYKLAPRPAILFSMAQAERRQYAVDRRPENLRRAVAHYRQYLKEVDKGGRRADAAQALSELEPMLAKLDAEPRAAGTPPAPPPEVAQTRLMVSTQTKGAEVRVDGTKAAELPVIEEVKPGRHRVRMMAPGYFDEERDVVAVKGGLVALDLSLRKRPARLQMIVPAGAQIAIDGRPQGLAPLPEIEVSPGSHVLAITLSGHEAYTEELELTRGETRLVRTGLRKTTQRRVAYGMLVVGGTGLALGAVSALVAAGKEKKAQEFLDAQAQGNVSPKQLEDYETNRTARDQWRTVSLGWLGAGAAFGVVGVLLYTFDQPVVALPATKERAPGPAPSAPSKPEGMEMSAAPMIAPGLFGGALSGRF